MSSNILEAENIAIDFRGFRAVDGVSLAVREGTVHALIGPNGAGKTTCFNLLTKFLTPTAGTLRYRGEDITGFRPARVARLGLVRSFQISATFQSLSLLENVRLALLFRRGRSFQFWRSQETLRDLDEDAMQLLDRVQLSSLATKTPAELSYGRKRALEIATTLAAQPKVLLLDEPTSGMGHEDIDPIVDLIRDVSRSTTVLMVEHNLKVVEALSDRVTVLARGKVLAEGSYQDVAGDPRVMSAYLGEGDD